MLAVGDVGGRDGAVGVEGLGGGRGRHFDCVGGGGVVVGDGVYGCGCGSVKLDALKNYDGGELVEGLDGLLE